MTTDKRMRNRRRADMAAAGVICAIIVCVLACCGCTMTRMESLEGGGFYFKRISVLQRTDVPEFSVATDGGDSAVTLKGYTNDGGAELIGAAVERAVSAAVKSATPAQ